MRVFEFLECFDLGTNVLIYDKERQVVLYQGDVADVPLKVCSQRNIVPDAKVHEGILNVTVVLDKETYETKDDRISLGK